MRVFFIGSLLSALVGLTACSPGGSETADAETGTAAATTATKTEPIKVLGRLVERSPLPDPKSSPYAECLFTASFLLHEPPSSVPTRITVVFEGYRERTLTPASRLATNDTCRLQIVPFADTPKSLQESQLIDTLDEIGLPLHWVREWTLQADALPSIATLPKDEEAPPAPPAPSPNPDQAVPLLSPLQAPAIRADLEHIETQLAERGGDWQQWSLDTAATVSELKRKLNVETSLVDQVGSNQVELLSLRPYYVSWDPDGALEAQVLGSLKALQRSFRKLGTDLILAPVPNRDEVVATHFAATNLPSPQRLRLLHHLLRHELEVIDLYSALVQGLREANDPLFYFGTKDYHPAAGTLRISARVIGKRIGRYDLPQSPPMTLLPTPYQSEKFFLTGTVAPTFRGYRLASEDGVPLVPPNASPVLVFGDSFVKVPESYGLPGANIAAHLAFETRVIPSYLTRPGAASRMNRNLARMPLTFLQNRKVAIFFFRIDDLFARKGEWESFDILGHRRLTEANFYDFHARAVPVAKYADGSAWSAWSCQPPTGAFPLKGKLGLPALAEPRRLQLDDSFPAGTYLLFFVIKSQSPTALSWSTKEAAETHPLKLEPGTNYFLRRFQLEESFSPRLHIPAQRGWLNIESIELRRLPEGPAER